MVKARHPLSYLKFDCDWPNLFLGSQPNSYDLNEKPARSASASSEQPSEDHYATLYDSEVNEDLPSEVRQNQR